MRARTMRRYACAICPKSAKASTALPCGRLGRVKGRRGSGEGVWEQIVQQGRRKFPSGVKPLLHNLIPDSINPLSMLGLQDSGGLRGKASEREARGRILCAHFYISGRCIYAVWKLRGGDAMSARADGPSFRLCWMSGGIRPGGRHQDTPADPFEVGDVQSAQPFRRLLLVVVERQFDA